MILGKLFKVKVICFLNIYLYMVDVLFISNLYLFICMDFVRFFISIYFF